ncbi:septum formation protein Maf [Clostridia bacterium]|nr:septum formation protein Maf [Clostridia bacterium]
MKKPNGETADTVQPEIKQVVLASQSKARAALFASLGISVKVYPTNTDESVSLNLPPDEIVLMLSKRKADTAAEVFGDDKNLIIAADTVVYYDGLILGKPSGGEDAYNMLSMLSGNYHEVYTGLTVALAGKNVSVCDRTRVKFREIDQSDIEAYIATGEPLSKAGSYGAQGIGAAFIESVEGDYFNVVGLPVGKLAGVLREEFGLSVFDLI